MRISRGLIPSVALSRVDGEGIYLQPDPRLWILYPHFPGRWRLLFMASAEKLISATTYTLHFPHCISSNHLKEQKFHARTFL